GRRDRVDERDRAFEGELVVLADDAGLLLQLAHERLDEALPRPDAATREEPVLLSRLFVPCEEDPAVPAQDRRHADARLARHQTVEEPNPRTPRSDSGSSSTSTGVTLATGRTTSWAILIPGSTTNGSLASVFRSTTRSSPR